MGRVGMARRIGAEETLEQMGPRFRCYADAGVADLDHQLPVVTLGEQVDGPARLVVGNGVVQQVGHYLRQPGTVRFQPHFLGGQHDAQLVSAGLE